MKAFKFRIYPNKETAELLEQWFGQARFVWNYYLNKRTVTYKDTGKGLSYADNAKDLTLLKKQSEYSWLKECPSQALQQTLKHLDSAFKDFFSRGKGYPKFKSKKHSNNSLHFPQGFKILNNGIKIPKVTTTIKTKFHREIKGNVRSIIVSKTPAGNYYVSILTDFEPSQLPKTKDKVGIDLGLKHFLIDSKGNKYNMPHFIKKSQKKLTKLQRKLSKKQKSSNNREKVRLKIAKLYEHITNQRLDFLHKLSTKLVREYDLIATESLCVKGMIKNHKLAKHITNASWGNFLTLLEYKAKWYGKEIVKLDKFFPSSKMCNNCGYLKEDLKLSDRTITCPSCGNTYDRDINAAKNILTFTTVGATGS